MVTWLARFHERWQGAGGENERRIEQEMDSGGGGEERGARKKENLCVLETG